MAFFVCHEIRRQMSVYFETKQTAVQSTLMDELMFGFTVGSVLQLNGKKTLEISSRRSDK